MLTMARVGFWERVRADIRVGGEEDGSCSVAVMLLRSCFVLVAPIWLTIVSGMGGGVIFVGREE